MANFTIRINMKWRERVKLLFSGSIYLQINASKRNVNWFNAHVMNRKERKSADEALQKIAKRR